MTGDGTVIVLAKAPVAGRVKTRLCPPLTLDEAAAVAAAALADTLTTVASARCARRVVALDGPADPWLPAGFEVVAQPTGTLDRRIAAAFAATSGPAVLVGMDTPQVAPTLIEDALAALQREADAVLGHAADGGYWIVGLRHADAAAFLGVPMSTATTGIAQQARFDALGLRTRMLPTLRDVDDYRDAVAVADLAPGTRFAAAINEVRGRHEDRVRS